MKYSCILQIVYFDEPLIRTLNSLDSLCQMDYTQKMNFFKQLPQSLVKFPKASTYIDIGEAFENVFSFRLFHESYVSVHYDLQ